MPVPDPLLEWVFVVYLNVEGGLWHQRWVIGRVRSSESGVVILTPDGDVYVEDVGDQSREILAARWSAARWPPPPG
eukprot:1261022-Lingulodinium_polyedra.AAC.1